MKKIFGILVVFALGFFMSAKSGQVFAIDSCSSVMGSGFSISGFNPDYGPIFIVDRPGSIHAQISGLTPGQGYTIACERNGFLWGWPVHDTFPLGASAAGTASINTNNDNCWNQEAEYRLKLTSISSGAECIAYEYESSAAADSAYCVTKSVTDSEGRSGCFDVGEIINWEFEVAYGDGTPYTEQLMVRANTVGGGVGASRIFSSPNGVISGTDEVANAADMIQYNVYAEANIANEITTCAISGPMVSFDACTDEEREGPTSLGPDVFSLCDQIPEEQPEQMAACEACTTGGEDNLEGIWTAIGCIKKDPQVIIKKLITVGLGVGGGFTLITFLAAGFIFSTSQGSPEKVKNAKEMMTASIIGLLFVIFSVSLLQFVGWSVLKIPGFGG